MNENQKIRKLRSQIRRMRNPYGTYKPYKELAKHTGFEKCREKVLALIEKE